MCGRFALKNPQALKAALDLGEMPDLPPRYSIAPTQDIAIIRAETVDTKPSFRAPFKHHRCIIPADGFYEWHEAGGIKIPHHIGREDGAPFALAGLWNRWKGPQGEVARCTIIVTAANRFMKPLHDRIPVILAPQDYPHWLDPDNHDTARLKQLLAPAPEDSLTEWPVSRRLNNPQHDGADSAEPAI
jgi:putative SOS response-associated peptidase YedK